MNGSNRTAVAGLARAHAVACGVPVVLTALMFWPALRTFFAADDVTFLSRAAGLEPSTWGGLRVLSGPVAWTLQYRAFGLHPLPYHAVLLALHLFSTVLVYVIGLRLPLNRTAASVAAVMFGTSVIAFTPLHWAAAISELMMTVCALLTLLAALIARGRPTRSLAWLGAGAYAWAVLSKESALLLIVPIIAASWPASRPSDGRSSGGRLGAVLRLLWSQGLVAAALGSFALAMVLSGRHLGGAAYAASLSLPDLSLNLLTYLRWMVDLGDPIPDRLAVAHKATLASTAIGLTLLVAAGLSLRRWRRAEVVGAAWFLALLAPVLPLTAHSYLYYLYAPWAGACWCLANVGLRAWQVRPTRWSAAVLCFATGIYVMVAFHNVRNREEARLNGLPIDRTMRESVLLRNCITGLEEAGLVAPDSVCFVNPLPKQHQDLTDRSGALHTQGTNSASYVPLAGALRDGEAVRLFFPGVRMLGFAESIPESWEAAAAFFYEDDGRLTALGRGVEAERRIGGLMLKVKRWELAEPTFRRAIALGDTSADTAYALLYSLAGCGRTDEATQLAVQFIKEWPHDPRSRVLDEALSAGAE